MHFWEKEKIVHPSHCITSGFPCRPETDDVYVTAKHVRRYTQPDVSDTESSEDENDQLEGEDITTTSPLPEVRHDLGVQYHNSVSSKITMSKTDRPVQ